MTDPNTNKTEEPIKEPIDEPIAAAPPPAAESATASETESDPTAPTMIQATLGNRVLAVLIDCLIVMAMSIVPVIGFLAGVAYTLTRDALPFLDGQSIGKKAMKLRAVSAQTGKPLTNDWGPSLIRNVVLYIPFFALVELIILSQNKDGQRLGDQWAKTKVVVVSEG